VRVVRGRKVPRGTTGIVFWHQDGRFGERVGIRADDGATHWTAARNCEVA